MKKLIIYTSQTGFTRKYAEWIAGELDAETMTLQNAKKMPPLFFKSYDAIAYGGWAMAGKVVKSGWFREMAKDWKDKRLTLFFTGASPVDSPDIQVAMEKSLSEDEHEYIKTFYFPGGLDYDKMGKSSVLVMKALSGLLKNLRDESKKKKGEVLSKSYDVSDKKYIEPLVEYFK